MSPTDRGRLHGLLREELRARLIPAGWVEDPAYDTEPGSGDVGVFRHPLGSEFAATAWFHRTLSPRSQIGVLEGSRAAISGEAMAAAAARHELPYLDARLARRDRPPRHLLEVAAPLE